MKTKTLVTTLLTIVLTMLAVADEEQPAQELSNTRRAEVTLRITTDPKTFPLGTERDNVERLTDIMFAQDVAQAVWEEMIDSSDWDGFVRVNIKEPVELGGLQTVQVGFEVSLNQSQKPAAKEFLEAYIKKLKDALRKEYRIIREFHSEKIQEYFLRKHGSESELQYLLETQSKLAGGQGKLDKESVRQRILEHERAKIDKSMQQAILRKRAEELVKQISKANQATDAIEAIRASIQDFQKERGQVKALYKKMDFERNQLVNKGVASAAVDVKTSKLSDLDAKISHAEREIDKLSEQKQQLEDQTAGDIRELNKQLRETTMKLQELEIQRSTLYGYSPGNISDSIEYEMLQVRIEAAKENLKRATIEADKAALEVNLLQEPSVTYDKIVTPETIPEGD